MKKEDLKHGNIVELRDGTICICTNHHISNLITLQGIVESDTYFYNEDLTNNVNGMCRDIVKVYEDYTLQNLLWERKEKPVLTEDEKVILRNLDKEFKWIARDKCGELYIFFEKPEKDDVVWSSEDDYENVSLFEHLFQFIKWEDTEPYLISELISE